MREEKISVPQHLGPEVDGAEAGSAYALTTQILDALEQGVILWCTDGTCLKHNQRMLDLMAWHPSELRSGTTLSQVLERGAQRGDTFVPDVAELLGLFGSGTVFHFEQTLSCGRIVSASARPVRNGGYVVAYSDVSEARASLQAIDVARSKADAAERKAVEILHNERARQREASRLAKLNGWLQSCKSLDELYQIVTSFMKLVLPGTQGQLFIYSNSRDILETTCGWNTADGQDPLTPDDCWALRKGRQYLYDPGDLCFVCDHVADATNPEGEIGKYLCVPIVAHGDTVGLLHLQFGTDNPEVTDAVEFASQCGEHISMAIANVKLRDELQDQSTRDPLTGLYNRRYFLDAMRRELATATTRQSTFVLLSLDADRFKQFNDEHGHDAGDHVLEMLSQKLVEMDVSGAVACRIGGEEFSVILPNADRTRAGFAAEELRQSVADMRVKHMGADLPKVTISLGIAIYPTHGTQAKDLIKQADLALYAAKKAGRNCWKVAEGDGMISFE